MRRAGLGPEIGVEQTGADPSLRARLGNRGQGRVDVFELSDVGVPEPIRPVGRPGHRRKPPEGAVQRQREIVGAAGLSDSVQQRIFGDRAVEPASERGPALDRGADRAEPIFVGLFRAVQDAVVLDDLAVAQPAQADAANLRVQDPHMIGGTPQWHIVAEEPPAQLVK